VETYISFFVFLGFGRDRCLSTLRLLSNFLNRQEFTRSDAERVWDVSAVAYRKVQGIRDDEQGNTFLAQLGQYLFVLMDYEYEDRRISTNLRGVKSLS
jgi:hypothetical protein